MAKPTPENANVNHEPANRIDETRLRELAEHSEFDGANVITAESVSAHYDPTLDRKEVVVLFEDLAERGWGKYKVGRHGHPTRLVLSDIADKTKENSRQPSVTTAANTVDLSFPLDNGSECKIQYVRPLSKRDMERVQHYLGVDVE